MSNLIKGEKKPKYKELLNTKYIPAITHKLIGWQYTSNGQVSRVIGSVDLG